MLHNKRQNEQEEREIKLLKKWLPKISNEYRAYIKGASRALLYAQEGDSDALAAMQAEEIVCHEIRHA